MFTPQKFPALVQAYWDGNGFSGTLPASVGSISTMETLSLQVQSESLCSSSKAQKTVLNSNINNFEGEFPVAFCGLKAKDCRIGMDHGEKWLAVSPAPPSSAPVRTSL